MPVRAIVSESKDPSRPMKSTKVSTSSNADYTAVKEIKGLKPDTQYYYDVTLKGKSSLAPEVPSFRPYFSQASKAHSKIAFGGGPHCGFSARFCVSLALLACGHNSLFYMELSSL
ncbi:MAG: PhoD-like phosphatase N-terminal domain-containing protein [Planctomycetota bacterium]